MTTATNNANVWLWPKQLAVFVVNEYIAPLSDGERMMVVATFLASFVSAYGVQSHLAGAYGNLIGWVGAIAVELVYLGGALAGSAARHRSGWQLFGIWLALGTAAALAIVFNLAHQQEARGALAWYAWAEAVGFPLLALLTAVVSHAIAGGRLEAQAEREAAEERLRLQAEAERQQQLNEYRRQRAEIELEHHRQQLASVRRASERERREQTKSASQRPANTPNSVRPERSREQLAEQAQTLLEQEPTISKTEAAKRLGIGRTTLYKILKEVTTQ